MNFEFMNKKVRKYILLTPVIGVIAPLIFLIALFLLVRFEYFGQLPAKEELNSLTHMTASSVFDRKGAVIGRYYIQDRVPVHISKISKELVSTLVAVEDQRFYQHKGIDAKSLLRVVIKTILLQDRSSGGGSTITQQLAKNLYGRKRYTYFYYPINKFREMIIARRIEDIYSKNEILNLYLNTVSFGLDIYGVESASKRFFNKSSANLNVAEAVTLVGMLKATTYYNPILNPEKSVDRRNYLLRNLADRKLFPAQYTDSLCALPLTPAHLSFEKQQFAGYVLNEVETQASIILEAINRQGKINYHLKKDGLKIYTSLDKSLQEIAEATVREKMKFLQEKFNQQQTHEFWSNLKSILDLELNKVKSPPLEVDRRSLFTWQGDTTMFISTIDSIKHALGFLQAGFLACQPATGNILAWVGGINYQNFPYDHVKSKRQVGSTLKPFIYATALEQDISPCKFYDLSQSSYEVDEEQWTPGNANNAYEGEVTMEDALTESINTVAVKVLQEAGIENFISLLRAAGIESEIPEVPSIALGTPSLSLLEIVQAYCTFVNNGTHIPLNLIEKITDRKDSVIYQRERPDPVRIMNDTTAMIIRHFLQNVVQQGTATSLRSKYRVYNDIGGKTGTTQNNADGWFVGISPQLVAGSWVGGTYPAIHFKSTRDGQGAATALPIFAQFFQKLNKDSEFSLITATRFPQLPEDVSQKMSCDPFEYEFNIFKWFLDRKTRRASRKTERVEDVNEEHKQEEDKGILKKFRSLFNRKKD
ncbi:MAG: transglycosylase domain-containing protein [Cyclobacteriaceae bacterium]|nr:transglycosylase domain-containing protein [Cyclobacteriaceae bacterium]